MVWIIHSLLPTILFLVDWAIRKNLIDARFRKRVVAVLEKLSEPIRKDVNRYWEQHEDLKNQRSERNKIEKKWPADVRLRGSLAIVVGHEKSSPGAWAAPPLKKSEWEYNNALANDVVAIGETRGHSVNVYLRDGVGIKGVYKKVVEWGLS